MKKCPFCAEEIQDDAIKCRYCNEFLDGRAPAAAPAPKAPWYTRTSTILIGFLFVGPLILPLVWMNPKKSNAQKLVWTVVMIGVTALLYKLAVKSYQSIEEYYSIVFGSY